MGWFVAVEGGLAAGKTTMAKELGRRLDADVLLEDFSRHPFLQEFYLHPEANALETELGFAILHYHTMAKALREGRFKGNVVSDFFYEKTMIFHRVTLTPKKDAGVFEDLWSALRVRLPTPDLVIFLEAPSKFMLRRVRKRGREYERPVTLGYVDEVNRAYSSFMKTYVGSRVLRLQSTKLDTSVNRDPFGEVASEVRWLIGAEGAQAARPPLHSKA